MSAADIHALVRRLIEQAMAERSEGNRDVVAELQQANLCMPEGGDVDVPRAVAHLTKAQRVAGKPAERLTGGARREVRQLKADRNRVMLCDTIAAALGLLTARQAEADAVRRTSGVVFQELANLASALRSALQQADRGELAHLLALVSQLGCVADAATLAHGGTMARGLSREWLMTPAVRNALRLQEGGAA